MRRASISATQVVNHAKAEQVLSQDFEVNPKGPFAVQAF